MLAMVCCKHPWSDLCLPTGSVQYPEAQYDQHFDFALTCSKSLVTSFGNQHATAIWCSPRSPCTSQPSSPTRTGCAFLSEELCFDMTAVANPPHFAWFIGGKLPSCGDVLRIVPMPWTITNQPLVLACACYMAEPKLLQDQQLRFGLGQVEAGEPFFQRFLFPQLFQICSF